MSVGAINWDYKTIENKIEDLESVISCRFVLDKEEFKEIHIVSNGTRPPKQISRDIQTVLVAKYDLDVDYKKISIAELLGEELRKKESRLKIDKILIEDKGTKANVVVGLSDDSKHYVSSMSGINTARHIDILLVKAVIDCVEQSLKKEDSFIIEDVKNINLYSNGVIVVVLVYIIDEQEQRLCGSCLIENDGRRAVVKATLDALNRSISKCY